MKYLFFPWDNSLVEYEDDSYENYNKTYAIINYMINSYNGEISPESLLEYINTIYDAESFDIDLILHSIKCPYVEGFSIIENYHNFTDHGLKLLIDDFKEKQRNILSQKLLENSNIRINLEKQLEAFRN